MRLFIAAEIAPEIKEKLASLIGELRRFGEPVRWLRVEAMHLTLKFIGEVSEEKLPLIKEALEVSAGKLRAGMVRIRGTGAFPNERRPRVLWVGVEDTNGQLRRAAELLEEPLSKIGIERESRPFRPHLTLGRVKRPGVSRSVAALKKRSEELFGEQMVEELVLFQSILRPDGAIYEVLARAVLGSE